MVMDVYVPRDDGLVDINAPIESNIADIRLDASPVVGTMNLYVYVDGKCVLVSSSVLNLR